MKINILGGGPSGLYFAILMKKQDPAHQITILERDGPDDTFGWGIVFSGKTLAELRDNDEPSYLSILDACQVWDNVEVVHREQTITIRGNRFTGTSRLAFLNILQRRAAELGTDICFRTNVADADLERWLDCDLFVGADGANSLVRRRFAEHFQPDVDIRRNRYIWLGTQRLFNGLTFLFRRSEAGVFVAHCYKFSPTHSTFVVECAESTWANARFDSMSDEDSCRYLERVFGPDLRGQPLLTNNFVRWLKFPIVRNRRWSHGHTVLLGDALHTAHFSIGSGTKLALEDSIALAACCASSRDVPTARAAFQSARKPAVDEYQQAAEHSLLWFENLDEKFELDPVPLAYQIMTRSGKIDDAQLRRRDPAFAELVEAWRNRVIHT